MRSIFFHPKAPSFSIGPHSSSSTSSASTTPRMSFSESSIDLCIEEAQALILKWNPETSTYANVTSIFYDDKNEAMHYIKCVNRLHRTMHFLVSENASSEKIILAQKLMQMAMKRLQKEFYQILSMNRAHLDPESVSTTSSRTSLRSSTSDFDDDGAIEEEVQAAGDSISEVEEVSSIAMADLRSIAECMISSGYGKECVNVYNVVRKSIIDEGVYRLGVEKMSSSQINKMDWEVLDLRIKSWLEAVKISVRTLFNGERILCDHVFRASESIRESCFKEICRDGATILFGFPELVAKTNKSPPEKMFRVLDMYSAISGLWPEIESIFSFESTSSIRSQALTSLTRLIESVRMMLAEFESTVQKDSSKSMASGGGVHSLTVQSMNYLTLLADYSNILSDILADWPPPPKSSLPESFLDSPVLDDSSAPAFSVLIAWLVLVLLCKLDGKAKYYKNVALSYLFLANNLRHVITKVRTSNLQFVLGDEWIAKHEAKVQRFIATYENIGWGGVLSSLPENPKAVISPAEAKVIFQNFNLRFEEAIRKQHSFVAPDPIIRDDIKGSIARKLVPIYREFYNTHRITAGSTREMGTYVVFTPEDIENYVVNLFFAGSSSGSASRSPSSVTSSPLRRNWRHWVQH